MVLITLEKSVGFSCPRPKEISRMNLRTEEILTIMSALSRFLVFSCSRSLSPKRASLQQKLLSNQGILERPATVPYLEHRAVAVVCISYCSPLGCPQCHHRSCRRCSTPFTLRSFLGRFSTWTVMQPTHKLQHLVRNALLFLCTSCALACRHWSAAYFAAQWR